jgi:hypothetical protein
MVVVPLFTLSFTSNTIIFFQFIASVTRFNVFPAETIIKKYLKFNDEEEAIPMTSNFHSMGYTTHSSILNLDTIFMMVIFSVGLLSLVLLAYHLIAKHLSPHGL